MRYIASRVRAGERLFGTWCALASSLTAEIAGRSGFDWVLLDMEHGPGGHSELLHQLQALESTPAAALVRVAWNDAVQIKRVLDLGASGIMVPYVQSAAEARAAVSAMRYPPAGIRGVASQTRAVGFGADFADYVARERELVTIVQIESAAGLEHARAIAAIDGVDVLFVGPLDLSTSLGIAGTYSHPRLLDALAAVGSAAREHGKAAGIFAPDEALLSAALDRGFTLAAMGSDGGIVAAGMQASAELLAKYR